MEILIPPTELGTEVREYLFRLQNQIESVLGETNDVAIREILPDRPKEGKLYYIKEDPTQPEMVGLYLWTENAWRKIVTDPVITF